MHLGKLLVHCTIYYYCLQNNLHCTIWNSSHYIGHNSCIFPLICSCSDQELSKAADFIHEDQFVCKEVGDQCIHEEVIEESKLVSSFHALLLGLPITQYQTFWQSKG